jgi:hypothetical protein
VCAAIGTARSSGDAARRSSDALCRAVPCRQSAKEMSKSSELRLASTMDCAALASPWSMVVADATTRRSSMGRVTDPWLLRGPKERAIASEVSTQPWVVSGTGPFRAGAATERLT